MAATQGGSLDYTPDYAVAPGETLRETIETLGIDQRDLAQRAGISEKHVSQLMSGQTALTIDMAQKLEMVTNVPARFWSNLEVAYRQKLAEIKAIQELESQAQWMRNFPVKELVKREKLQRGASDAETTRNLLAFFGTAAVETWKALWMAPQAAWRRSQCFTSNPYVTATWLRLGELDAQVIVTQPYEQKRFEAALAEIRTLTTEPPQVFQPKMVSLCASAGVAVVFVPEIKGCPASGVSRWLTPTKALVQLSLRFKTDDHFWFSFFHEAGHILHNPKKALVIETPGGEGDAQEAAADGFASEILIPSKHKPRLHQLQTAAEVTAFAKELGIAPGIVVGRLQHDKLIPFSYLNQLKRRLAWA